MVKKQTICLSMIVKNESHIILEVLKQVTPYISYWAISDTGSTDGTQDIIKNYFKSVNINGILAEHKWKNFGYNRTMALKLAYDKSDYVWIIDADDMIVGNLKFPEPMIADAYNLKYGLNFTYDRLQILKNTIK